MAAPAITTLLSPNPASGILTANGTEQTLASGASAAGLYQLDVDCAAMQAKDEVELRVYKKVNNSAMLGVLWAQSFSGEQAEPIKQLPPVATPGEIRFTLTQSAGENRTYPWAVTNLVGV